MLTMLFAGTAFTGCIKGDTGATGATGAQGNANVTEETYNNYLLTLTNSGTYEVDLSLPKLTQSIQNTGAVNVYIQYINETPYWWALPYTDDNGVSWSFVTTTGNIAIEASSQPITLINAKVVLIASPQLAKNHITKTQAKYLSYKEAVTIANN